MCIGLNFLMNTNKISAITNFLLDSLLSFYDEAYDYLLIWLHSQKCVF